MVTLMNQFLNLYVINKRVVVTAIIALIILAALSVFLLQQGIVLAGPATSDSYCSC
jgi:hypothetical protein